MHNYLEVAGPYEIHSIPQAGTREIRARRYLVAVTNSDENRLLLSKTAEWKTLTRKSNSLRFHIYLDSEDTLPSAQRNNFSVLHGDDSDWNETSGRQCMTYGTEIYFDFKKGLLKIFSSALGLPPIFIFQTDDYLIFTSDIHLLRSIAHIKLSLNAEAVRDWFRIGYPLWCKTLFQNVYMMPAGTIREYDQSLNYSTRQAWDYSPAPEPDLDLAGMIRMQKKSFRAAVNKLMLGNSFLSLTGGMDSRAILSVLIDEGKSLPACTLSGNDLKNIDALTAAMLCRQYNLKHTTIYLDETFLLNLPEYVSQASKLSGGLSGFEQAHEVYFFETLKNKSSRISGTVANKVGRLGLQGLSYINSDLSILSPDFLGKPPVEKPGHWLMLIDGSQNMPLIQALLKYETPFSSVCNFCIGSSYMLQQTPYADRDLIKACLLNTNLANKKLNDFSKAAYRIKDLRYRFLGQPISGSFQRQIIAETGGFIAKAPINWGWRAKGGISPSGFGRGLLCFMNVLADRDNPMSKCLNFLQIGNIYEHSITKSGSWLKTALKDFTYDILGSRAIKDSGILDNSKINQKLEEHFTGKRDNYKTIIKALDVALAHRNFL